VGCSENSSSQRCSLLTMIDSGSRRLLTYSRLPDAEVGDALPRAKRQMNGDASALNSFRKRVSILDNLEIRFHPILIECHSTLKALEQRSKTLRHLEGPTCIVCPVIFSKDCRHMRLKFHQSLIN
jgi:hypothetical protein